LPLAWFGIFERPTAAPLVGPSDAAAPETLDGWEPSVSRERFDRDIASIHDSIARGDTYQVNYSMRLRTALHGDPDSFYRKLCLAQRASYCACLAVGRYRILSASPELFFRVDRNRITTRPMKGTIRRGFRESDDDELRRRLAASVKDRAENAMIVDLLRNDVGRVAVPGSVRYPSLFNIEPYESVWQMTSTVKASLDPATTFVDVMRAIFPSGSITGAPKVRTMEIISELEDSPRGVYTGTIGFLAPAPRGGWQARFNVAIRTVTVDTVSRLAEYGVGGGITWDSTARGEYDEVLAKATVLTLHRPVFILIETMRFEPATGFRSYHPHLDRMASSARYFGFAFDREMVARVLEDAVTEAAEKCVVRCSLERNGACTASIRPLPEETTRCVRLEVDQAIVDPAEVLSYHKTSWRVPYEAAMSRHPGADDVVLVNRLGRVTETTIGNLAVKLEGAWWTPPVEDGLLPGIERAREIQRGRLRERSLAVRDVETSEDLAVINSVRGWRPARLVRSDE